jgi:hypothetical protein
VSNELKGAVEQLLLSANVMETNMTLVLELMALDVIRKRTT